MSFWPLLLIVFAIIMAIGPIMLMQPSNKDKRLANLRQKAVQMGLQVRMNDYSKGEQKITVAIYTYPVNLSKNAPCWSLVRRAYEHEIHFHGVWEWQSSTILANRRLPDLQCFIDKLSDDIVGLEVNHSGVGIWWQEKPSTMTIKELRGLLEELAAIAA